MLEREHVGADGIIGLDALQDFRVLIDFRKETMEILETRKRARPIIRDDDAIVVTARKRSENIQDVPASISALSSFELNRRFDSDVRDFADSSPNIVIDDTQQGPGGVAAVYIRGIGVADAALPVRRRNTRSSRPERLA